MNFFIEERKIMRNDLGLNISDGYLSFDSSDFSRGIHLFTCRVGRVRMEKIVWILCQVLCFWMNISRVSRVNFVIDEIIFLFFRMKLFFFYLLLVERTRKNYVELRSCIKYFLILLVELWKELG